MAKTKCISIVLALVALPLVAALPAPTTWTVASDTTFEDVPLAIAQDILVLPGATLRLETVDAVVLRPLNITIRGTLALVEGTRLASAIAPFDLYVAPGGSLLASDASLVGARVVVAGEAIAEAATFASGAFAVLGEAEVRRSAFDAAIGPAAFVRPGGSLLLSNSTVGQTGDYGIRIEGGSARIENTSFAFSPSYSLYVAAGDVTLVDSRFEAHCGAFLASGATGVLARNVFATLDHGVSAVSTGAFAVEDNTFEGTATALLTFGGAVDVARNLFVDNDVAVQTIVGSATTPILRDNAFGANGIAVKNDATPILDARENWWGSAAGPAAGDTSGAVDASAWLTAI